MLILDCDPASDLGTELRGLLLAAGMPHVERRTIANVRHCTSHDVADLSRFDGPPLILLVVPSAVLEAPESLLEAIRSRGADVAILAVTDGGEPRDILRLLELGIHDFIAAPLRPCEVIARISRWLDRTRGTQIQIGRLKEKVGLRQLVGDSPAFLAAIDTIALVARCDASVLILGETGTGKELAARAIHYLSPRAPKPFVAINCGALPTDLVENELFGHERSAYTGAFTERPGVVHEAEGGTLLLDEIDTLPLLAQVKLLRFLQEKEYRPLGASRPIKADVRVLAASNGDLEQAVRGGRLRQDLYYRLSVIPLRLPPLRDRREDIPRLARHFLRKYAMPQRQLELSARALQMLLEYDWPGNVRELEHVVERAAILSGHAELIREQHVLLSRPPVSSTGASFQRAKADAVARFESSYVRELLAAHDGNISRAARAAGKNRRAFWELIRKHGIDARTFRSEIAADQFTRR
jgi:two-component system, NtrC family, response regulator GlrR